MKPEQAAEIILAQFPDVSPKDVSYLGEGCDSTAFDVDGQWVFRFPKRDDVEQQLLVEIRVLPVLAKESPIPLPEFCFHGRPSNTFPRHFGGYPKLHGMPAIGIDPATIPFDVCASRLGQFLSWLHRFPVSEADRLGVPAEDVVSLVDEVRGDALDDFGLLDQMIPDAPLEEWYRYIATGPPKTSGRLSSDAVLVHRDLAAEHVLLDSTKRKVTGIIDWSEMAIGDRSIDFAGLFHWGGETLTGMVLSHYDHPIDDAELRRARFLAACRGVGDVAFGIETSRPEYIASGIRALELCIGRDRNQ